MTRRIGPFDVDGMLAHQPGVVRVYAASDRRGEPVTLRVLVHAHRSDRAWRMHAGAAALWRDIEHRGLVPLLGTGRAREGIWVATRRGAGPTLAEHLQQHGRLAPASALAILAPVGGALDLAHARGLVCDTLSAETVVVGGPPGAETGALSGIGPSWPPPWRPGRLLGDPGGLAPEEIRGAAPSPAGNVYALAALLVHCLTGAPPFAADSRPAVLLAHLTTPPPRPSDVRPELPAAFDRIVASALAKDPDERPPTAGELMRRAGAALEVEVASLGRAPKPVASTERGLRRSGGRHRMPAALRLAPSAVLVAVAVYVAAHGLPTAGLAPRRPAPPGAAIRPAGAPLAQAPLRSPAGSQGAGAPTGAVRIDAAGKRLVFTIAATHLPPEGRHPVEAYTVWLLDARGPALRLGAINPPVGRSGHVLRQATLPPGSSRYDRVVLTLERSLALGPAGPVVLRGRLRIPRG